MPETGCQELRLSRDLPDGLGQHPERGYFLYRFFFVQVLAERGFQAGEGELVDAERTSKGVRPDGVEVGLFTEDQPCLGPAEELVAAEGEDVHAGVYGLLHRGLVADAVRCQVNETAAPQVPHHGDVVFLSKDGKLRRRDLFDKAHDLVIARMDLEQESGVFVDGLLVIFKVRLVRRSHFAELRAAPLHDLGHAEGPADLHEFAAGDDDLLAPRQSAEAEEHCRGVVVHRRGRLHVGQSFQDVLNVGVALAALSRGNIVFQVGVAAAHFHNALDSFLREERTSEVRMDDHARGIDDGLEARP